MNSQNATEGKLILVALMSEETVVSSHGDLSMSRSPVYSETNVDGCHCATFYMLPLG